MKFKYIGPNGKDEEGMEIPANCYGGSKLLNGESVELDGFLAEKAAKNPNYEEVKRKRKVKPVEKGSVQNEDVDSSEE